MKMMRRANHASSAGPTLPLQTTTPQRPTQTTRATTASASRNRPHRSSTKTPSNNKRSFSLLQQKQGSIILHPGIVAAFAIFSITALLAIHVFLFHQATAVTSSNNTPHHNAAAASTAAATLHIQVAPMTEPVVTRMTTSTDASSFSYEQPPPVSPLQPSDYQHYTIRINTWKRPEQLKISLDHHVTCPSVAQIQVVWCTAQGEQAPAWLTNYNDDRVVVEYHEENTLSERFRLSTDGGAPTAAVLTIDDDVLRPCLAITAGFVKWTRSPDRMVGFDARGHGVVVVGDNNKAAATTSTTTSTDSEQWMYSYLSTTENTNSYSLTLTRYAFIHRDYLDSYFTHMPEAIRARVDANLNCEDVAMSFWVSALTAGLPPLLADQWAIKSQVKLYSTGAISSTHNHKAVRNACVNDFADMLNLKNRLKLAEFVHDDNDHGLFECGAPSANDNGTTFDPTDLQVELEQQVQEWKDAGAKTLLLELGELRQEASRQAFEEGFLQGSRPWKERFRSEEK